MRGGKGWSTWHEVQEDLIHSDFAISLSEQPRMKMKIIWQIGKFISNSSQWLIDINSVFYMFIESIELIRWLALKDLLQSLQSKGKRNWKEDISEPILVDARVVGKHHAASSVLQQDECCFHCLLTFLHRNMLSLAPSSPFAIVNQPNTLLWFHWISHPKGPQFMRGWRQFMRGWRHLKFYSALR